MKKVFIFTCFASGIDLIMDRLTRRTRPEPSRKKKHNPTRWMYRPGTGQILTRNPKKKTRPKSTAKTSSHVFKVFGASCPTRRIRPTWHGHRPSVNEQFKSKTWNILCQTKQGNRVDKCLYLFALLYITSPVTDLQTDKKSWMSKAIEIA